MTVGDFIKILKKFDKNEQIFINGKEDFEIVHQYKDEKNHDQNTNK